MTDDSPSGTTNQVPPVQLDTQRQALARAYARQRYRLLLVNVLVTFALLLAFLVSGASLRLKDELMATRLMQAAPSVIQPALLVALYVAIVFVAYTLVMLPLDWWGGYVLPHRYGQSTQTRRGWMIDGVKSLALGLLMGIPAAVVLYWLLGHMGATWWIWASAFFIAVSVVMDFLYPVLILPLFYKLVPLADAELTARIARLAERTGAHIAGVYTIDLSSRTVAANAMVMGLGRNKRIALGDTLYSEFTPDEIETIIAHELGHQVHRDMELGIVAVSVITVSGMFIADRVLEWGAGYFGFSGPADIAALPLLALALAVFGLLTQPLSNAYSRRRERMADAYAMRVTGRPAAFASAMTRLANQNLAQVDPPRWIVWLLYSHPPISERLSMAQRMSQEQS